MPLTHESLSGDPAARSDPHSAGRQAALLRRPRTENPHGDGRTREHRLWNEGYDSVATPSTSREEAPVPRQGGGDIFVAKESGVAHVDGEFHTFTKGVTRVRAGHPLLRQVPEYFEPMDLGVHYDVEQATKAPGERRGD